MVQSFEDGELKEEALKNIAIMDGMIDKDEESSNEVIMEYLVKISKKACILELKQRHLNIIVLTSYTPYTSRRIRRICACTSQKSTREKDPIRRIQRRPICRIQNSSYLDLRKKYRLSLKNDMLPRDK
ncbi:hypothetical protein Tco_0860472 [Tanacetum coccineum]|uniref:Uncharacterized protein n=1 Tax=Tanacetum coccineum TaxID=301880 RepID=A0ABQ5BF01_9ASTR